MKLAFLLLCLFSSTSFGNYGGSGTEAFAFVVEDVFQLSTGQLVVSGQITSGEIRVTEQLKIQIDSAEVTVAIAEMQIFGRTTQTDTGFKGDYVAFTIAGVQKSQLSRGMIFTKNSVTGTENRGSPISERPAF